jgi:DNA repair exonuclease SbcCD ATPase subunit
VSGEAVVDVDITTLQSRERSIQNAINEHRENKNNYAHRIDEIRNDLSLLDELEERLEQLKGYKDELLKQHKTLMQAMKFLTSANDNLSSKYLSPMKNGINKYLKLVLRGDYENDMNIDTDLNVSFERYGKARGLDYLSKGYQEVVDISIRFALIDTLFSKEKPFIILDDPFVNMDKNKIQNALALLREFSKEYQLIYLVCHESRC